MSVPQNDSETKRALLLVGHGSEFDERSSKPVRENAARLRVLRGFDSVHVAFWKEKPDVEGAIARCAADEVVVMPMFTSNGYYAARVIPEALGLDRSEFGDPMEVDGHRVAYTPPFGVHPDIETVVESRVFEAIGRSDVDFGDYTVVVAGHGTPKHDRSSASTERVARKLRETRNWGDVRTGFIDEEPTVDAAVEAAETVEVVVVPFFVSEGGHATEDIPAMLGADGGVGDFPIDVAGRRVRYAAPVGTAPDLLPILVDLARRGARSLDESVGGSPGDWTLRRLMSEVVGSGPKTAADMTRDQAAEAFGRILAGTPEPETLGGFWVANRWKKNTPEELGAFIDEMNAQRTGVVEPAAGTDPVVDCGANYDGKRKTLLLGVASGLISAACGAPVAVHSGGRVPTKEGDTYGHVLQELGARIPSDVSESRSMLDELGFAHFDQRDFHPALAGLVDRRRHLGVRTFINTVETLANPALAPIHVGSFYHLAFATKVIDAIRESETSRFERIVMFQGLEGYDDVRPGSTKVVVWDGDEIDDFDLETADYGLDVDREALACESVAKESAQVTREVLLEGRRDHVREAVCLNAAVRLFAAGVSDTVQAGVERARESVESGEPGRRLQAMIEDA